MLPGHEPTVIVQGLISMEDARLAQHRPVLGKVPWR